MDNAALFRSLRLSAGLTQQALANALELHVTVVNRYENGKMPIPRAVLIAVECLAKHRPASPATTPAS